LENPDPANPAPAMLSLLFLVIGAWVLTIWVRIVRAAFEWPIFVSIAFVLAQNIVALVAYGALFQLSPAKV
jgi:hypothetical protein